MQLKILHNEELFGLYISPSSDV